MKILLSILALTFAACAQAAPVVEIKSAAEVRVDSVNFGSVADAIANNPALAPAIQRALVTYADKLVADRLAAEAALTEASQIATRARAAHARNDSAALSAALDDAEKPAKTRKKEELAKQIADLQAQRAALDK